MFPRSFRDAEQSRAVVLSMRRAGGSRAGGVVKIVVKGGTGARAREGHTAIFTTGKVSLIIVVRS